MYNTKKYIHLIRVNLYILESLLPRFGSLLFLPILLNFISSTIWSEIVLMIAVSEILSKLYLFGFQNSIFRFAKNLNIDDFSSIFTKLLKRLFFISIVLFIFLESFHELFWNNLFEFKYGLPMRSTLVLGVFFTLNIFFTEYVKAIQLSRKLVTGGILYTILNFSLQFSSIYFISIFYGRTDRMIVTAYLFSTALASIIKSIYFYRSLNLNFIFKKTNKTKVIKLFDNYATPSAYLSIIAIFSTHGSKIIAQQNISLSLLGKYFVYLSFANVFLNLFLSAQNYLLPSIFQKKSEESISIRVTLLYFSLFTGHLYYLIFNVLEKFVIPESFLLDTNIVYLIFLTQIIATLRIQPGNYYSISQKINKKLFLQSMGVILLTIGLINSFDIKSLVVSYLIFYALTTVLFVIFSGELFFLKHILVITSFVLIFFYFQIYNSIPSFISVFLLVLVVAFIFQTLNKEITKLFE